MTLRVLLEFICLVSLVNETYNRESRPLRRGSNIISWQRRGYLNTDMPCLSKGLCLWGSCSRRPMPVSETCAVSEGVGEKKSRHLVLRRIAKISARQS